MITKFKIFENYQRFINGKYWIVKSDDSYIGMILKAYGVYDNYKGSFINNRHMKEIDKIIMVFGTDTVYNKDIFIWDKVTTDRIKYYDSESFVYSGEILNDDDVVRFKKEFELSKNIDKYNL